jgi:hypothetical protein
VTDPPRRALSLIQPWAWAVIHGPKDVENRVWWTNVRGLFWIAASAQVTRGYYESARSIIEHLAPGTKVPRLADLDYGCIIGQVAVVDCILPGGYTVDDSGRDAGAVRIAMHRARAHRTAPGPRHPRHPQLWHFLDQYGYLLENRRALAQTVPCKGHQRSWLVPPAVLETLKGIPFR